MVLHFVPLHVDLSSRLELRVSVVLFLSSLLERSHDDEVSSWCTIYPLWNHVPVLVHM